jgi:hypothetical protein
MFLFILLLGLVGTQAFEVCPPVPTPQRLQQLIDRVVFSVSAVTAIDWASTPAVQSCSSNFSSTWCEGVRVTSSRPWVSGGVPALAMALKEFNTLELYIEVRILNLTLTVGSLGTALDQGSDPLVFSHQVVSFPLAVSPTFLAGALGPLDGVIDISSTSLLDTFVAQSMGAYAAFVVVDSNVIAAHPTFLFSVCGEADGDACVEGVRSWATASSLPNLDLVVSNLDGLLYRLRAAEFQLSTLTSAWLVNYRREVQWSMGVQPLRVQWPHRRRTSILVNVTMDADFSGTISSWSSSGTPLWLEVGEIGTTNGAGLTIPLTIVTDGLPTRSLASALTVSPYAPRPCPPSPYALRPTSTYTYLPPSLL